MNINAMMKGAKEMQQKMESVKTQVATLRCTGSAGGEMVVVVATGDNEIESVKVHPDFLTGDDLDMLPDLIKLACNEALGKVKSESEKMYANVMPAGLPAGLSGML